jgi:hypothetical protein
MRRTVVWGWTLLVLPACGGGTGTPVQKYIPKAERPLTPLQQECESLLEEVRKVQKEVNQASQKASPEEEDKLVESNRKRTQAFVRRFLALAQKDPKDPGSFDALTFVVLNGTGPEVDTAVALLLQDHAGNVSKLSLALTHAPSRSVVKLLQYILDTRNNAEGQAQAAFDLGDFFKNQAERAHEEGQPDAGQMDEQAERHFELVVKIGAAAELQKKTDLRLFELRHLWFGTKAPEIEGEDIDGKKFKLSDHRGKVVLLAFWGNW